MTASFIAYQTTYVYPLPVGLRYTEPPPVFTSNTTTGWVRLFLAQNLAVDIAPGNRVLTNIGFLFPTDCVGHYIQVFDTPSSIVIDGTSYTLSDAPRNFKVLSVSSMTDHEQTIAEAGVSVVGPTAELPAILLSYLPGGVSDGDYINASDQYDPPSIIDLVDNSFPFNGSPNPYTTGTYTGNPINNPYTGRGAGYGGSGTVWFIVDGVPDPTVGGELDLALDAITGNIYQKQQGSWTIVAHFGTGGGGGGGGGADKFYEYTQLSAATVWNIPHGLAKYPSITCVDPNGNEMIGENTWPTINTSVINFLYPLAGKAWLN